MRTWRRDIIARTRKPATVARIFDIGWPALADALDLPSDVEIVAVEGDALRGRITVTVAGPGVPGKPDELEREAFVRRKLNLLYREVLLADAGLFAQGSQETGSDFLLQILDDCKSFPEVKCSVATNTPLRHPLKPEVPPVGDSFGTAQKLASSHAFTFEHFCSNVNQHQEQGPRSARYTLALYRK